MLIIGLAIVACIQAVALAWIGLLMARERAAANAKEAEKRRPRG